MSVSFYGYVTLNDRWHIPSEIAKRLLKSIAPTHGTPEWSEWWHAAEDDSRFANRHYDQRLDVNMSERNARFVLNELGFGNDDVIEIDAFIIGVTETIRRLGNEPAPGLPGYIDSTPGRPTIISMGVDDGYVNTRLSQLLVLAQVVKELGASHIGWG